jgi:hypothetical protein
VDNIKIGLIMAISLQDNRNEKTISVSMIGSFDIVQSKEVGYQFESQSHKLGPRDNKFNRNEFVHLTTAKC